MLKTCVRLCYANRTYGPSKKNIETEDISANFNSLLSCFIKE